MNIPDNVDGLDKIAYQHGHDPIDWAEGTVGDLICVHWTVMAARAENPAAYPGYTIEPSIAALSRRILGGLLDAGWTPPAGP